MTKRCDEYEMEIASAAGGELHERVERHLEQCPGCRSLRDETLAMAGAARTEPDAPEARIGAIARQAIREAQGRRPALWAVPLLSASASAAALILYFGIFHADTNPAGGTEKTDTGSAQSLTGAAQVNLPDSLRAVSDLLLEQTDKESRQ